MPLELDLRLQIMLCESCWFAPVDYAWWSQREIGFAGFCPDSVPAHVLGGRVLCIPIPLQSARCSAPWELICLPQTLLFWVVFLQWSLNEMNRNNGKSLSISCMRLMGMPCAFRPFSDKKWRLGFTAHPKHHLGMPVNHPLASDYRGNPALPPLLYSALQVLPDLWYFVWRTPSFQKPNWMRTLKAEVSLCSCWLNGSEIQCVRRLQFQQGRS